MWSDDVKKNLNHVQDTDGIVQIINELYGYDIRAMNRFLDSPVFVFESFSLSRRDQVKLILREFGEPGLSPEELAVRTQNVTNEVNNRLLANNYTGIER